MFYTFSDSPVSRTVLVCLDMDAPIDSIAMRLTTGDYSKMEFPIEGHQVSGRYWRDLLGTGYVGLFLISDRLKNILIENHFTGWQSFPVFLRDSHSQPVDGFSGLSVVGRSGPTRVNESDRIITSDKWDDGYNGYAIDDWDGSDIFLPQDRLLQIHVTERVYKTLNAEKITNIHCEDISTVFERKWHREEVDKRSKQREYWRTVMIPSQLKQFHCNGQMEMEGLKILSTDDTLNIINCRNSSEIGYQADYSTIRSLFQVLCSVSSNLQKITEGKIVRYFLNEAEFNSL